LQDPTFEPVFEVVVDDLDLEDYLDQTCGDAFECRYDLVAIGREELASASRETVQVYEVAVQETAPGMQTFRR